MGLFLLGVCWTVVNVRGLVLALQHRYAEHGRWMIRSYALTFAAVTLRVYIGLQFAFGLDHVSSYRVICWICWIPNAVFTEAWLWRAQISAAFAPKL